VYGRLVLVRFLGWLWALPTTVLGLLLGLLSFQMPRRLGSLILFDGKRRGVTALLARMHRTAMTLGFVILGNRRVEGRLLTHERHHVRQSMWWGPFFVPVYLALAVRYGYRGHPFERAARRVSGEE
jgi:hypothetical protein